MMHKDKNVLFGRKVQSKLYACSYIPNTHSMCGALASYIEPFEVNLYASLSASETKKVYVDARTGEKHQITRFIKHLQAEINVMATFGEFEACKEYFKGEVVRHLNEQIHEYSVTTALLKRGIEDARKILEGLVKC